MRLCGLWESKTEDVPAFMLAARTTRQTWKPVAILGIISEMCPNGLDIFTQGAVGVELHDLNGWLEIEHND